MHCMADEGQVTIAIGLLAGRVRTTGIRNQVDNIAEENAGSVYDEEGT